MRIAFISAVLAAGVVGRGEEFRGRHFVGRGDGEYLGLLETSRRFFEPDPEFQNVSMLYTPAWNGFVEGPTWDAWWIQNSYGTTYCALPFLDEPYVTWVQNAQDLWFKWIGDGKRAGKHGWVGPDGCLCDAASPTKVYYRQGDGKIGIHDWAVEFTAAGVVMQAELLLISRDQKAIARYLPMLERCANFIESRRDPKNNLFLAGPAGNLLAPSYAGWKKGDGTYDKAYLAGLSVTYIAALDRLIELEKLAGRGGAAAEMEKRREAARAGLAGLVTPEGYFVRSIDPDGTRHGVFGAGKHGYFETSPNHDAIAFRVVDLRQAGKIYEKIAEIPELRPHGFVLPNYPAYDDMYEEPNGIWAYGTWVNGGHWSTCEGRMVMAYARLGKFDDIRASHKQLMKFARAFRMDNPLTERGNAVYQPNEAINICYDTFAPAAASVRGLFEYVYRADTLVLVPHVPKTVTELHQQDPIRWGGKRLYLSAAGAGDVTEVKVNGAEVKTFTPAEVTLKFEEVPEEALVEISMGGAECRRLIEAPAEVKYQAGRYERYLRFYEAMDGAGMGDSYEAGHARVVLEAATAAVVRGEMLAAGGIEPLAEKRSQEAADKAYADTAAKVAEGLAKVVEGYRGSGDGGKEKVVKLWEATK